MRNNNNFRRSEKKGEFKKTEKTSNTGNSKKNFKKGTVDKKSIGRTIDKAFKRDRRTIEEKKFETNNEFKIEGRNAVIEVLKSDKTINKLMVLHGDRQGSIKEIIRLARERNIIITEVDKNKLDRISETKHHQGVIAMISPIEYKTVSDILKIAKERNEDPFIIVADEIEDPYNLGALIRSAEIAGCHGIIIPKRRAVAVTEIVSKVSCGATEYLPVARVNNINEIIRELKEKGLWVIGTDENAAKLYYEEDLSGPIAIVIGSEGKGISKVTMDNCDMVVKIPMKGHIPSLNASVSGGIIMFEVLKQRMGK